VSDELLAGRLLRVISCGEGLTSCSFVQPAWSRGETRLAEVHVRVTPEVALRTPVTQPPQGGSAMNTWREPPCPGYRGLWASGARSERSSHLATTYRGHVDTDGCAALEVTPQLVCPACRFPPLEPTVTHRPP
jgi:hypothetical protein